MSWSKSNETSSKLDVLVELGRQQGGQYPRADLDAGLELVATRLEAHHARRRQLRRMAPLAALLLAGVLGLFVASHWLLQPAPLSYEVHGGAVLDAGYLRESHGETVVIQFEEGTRFALASGARARLRSVDARGARLGLESGAASFHVTPDATRRWEVEVGPFLVQVKGTVFDVAWDPAVEQFQLDLARGQVLVSGPVSGGELTLHGGQKLVVHLGKGETKITESRGEVEPTSLPAPGGASASPANAAAGTAASSGSLAGSFDGAETRSINGLDAEQAQSSRGESPDGPGALELAPATSSGRESVSPKPPRRQWADALARGQWDDILRDAEDAGIPTVLTTASAEELFTLANAARYRQRTTLARDALVALRQRHPGSGRARDAVFLLGRVAESRGETKAADTWYADYLTSAPNGTYAAEALGRRMTLQSRSAGVARARPLAEEYLRRFPKGSYAGSARAVLESR